MRHEDLQHSNDIPTASAAKVFARAQSMSLKIEEKVAMRAALMAFVETHPSPIRSPWFSTVSNHISSRMALIPAALFLLIILFGGSSFAQLSLPGDILYPVKLNVNEKLQAAFSSNEKDQAVVAAMQALSRLTETEKLANAGKLNANIATNVQADFVKSANVVAQSVQTLQAQGKQDQAMQINSDFESALKDHHDLLVALSQKGGDQGNLLTGLGASVAIHLTLASQNRTLAEKAIASSSPASLEASARDSMKSAQDAMDVVFQNMNIGSTTTDVKLQAEAETQMTQAKQNMAAGKAKLDVGLYAEAYTLFDKASRIIEETSAMLQAKDEIKSTVTDFLRVKHGSDETATSTEKTATTSPVM